MWTINLNNINNNIIKSKYLWFYYNWVNQENITKNKLVNSNYVTYVNKIIIIKNSFQNKKILWKRRHHSKDVYN